MSSLSQLLQPRRRWRGVGAVADAVDVVGKSLERAEKSVVLSTRAGSRVVDETLIDVDDLEMETFEVEAAVTSCLGCGCGRVEARDGVVIDVATLEHVGKDS